MGRRLPGAGGAGVCPAADGADPRPATEAKAWKGDFDGMVARRHVRVLVPYSRTLYFNDKGGSAASPRSGARVRALHQPEVREAARQAADHRLHGATTRDELLKDVADGLGDIAAGNLTVTDERKKIVDFVAPADQKPVSEVVLTGPRSPAMATADDLAGRTVHVRRASSYYESLLALNDRLKQAASRKRGWCSSPTRSRTRT